MIIKFKSDLPMGRQRYLAQGAWAADAIAQVKARGMEAALEAVATMGGAGQKKAIARGLVKAAATFVGGAYKIETTENGQRMVYIPNLTWDFVGRGARQRGEIKWIPMFGGPRVRQAAAAEV